MRNRFQNKTLRERYFQYKTCNKLLESSLVRKFHYKSIKKIVKHDAFIFYNEIFEPLKQIRVIDLC